MKHPFTSVALALALLAGTAGVAWAGAPTPDLREADFKHVCKGGPNKDLACTVANAATDCPKSDCVLKTLSKTIKGTLTIIAHDDVRDWLNAVGGNQALTLMLEVKGPDGTKQILASTYQDIAFPNSPPQALANVVSIDMNETNVQGLAAAVSGLMFAQPEAVMAQQLQTLFGVTGTPTVVAVKDKKVQFADHTADGLATVLRFKLKIQFLDPV